MRRENVIGLYTVITRVCINVTKHNIMAHVS